MMNIFIWRWLVMYSLLCVVESVAMSNDTRIFSAAPYHVELSNNVIKSSASRKLTKSRRLQKKSLTVTEFCSDLDDVESFLYAEFQRLVQISDETSATEPHTCICTSDDDSASPNNFTLFCSINYQVSNEAYSNQETMIFKANDNKEYLLQSAEWCQKYPNTDFECQKVTYCENGQDYCACQGLPGCSRCEICPGGRAITLDCTNSQLNITFPCGSAITGAILSTYDFPKITTGDYNPPPPVPETQFCSDMSELQNYMTHQLKRVFQGLPVPITSTYDCECLKTESSQLGVTCSIQYMLGDDSITNTDKAIFQKIENNHALGETEWCETVGNRSFCDKTTYCEGSQDLCSCSGSDCASCQICPDKMTLALDCVIRTPKELGYDYNTTCDDLEPYYGSFFNTYNLPRILVEDDTSKTSEAANNWLFFRLNVIVLIFISSCLLTFEI